MSGELDGAEAFGAVEGGVGSGGAVLPPLVSGAAVGPLDDALAEHPVSLSSRQLSKAGLRHAGNQAKRPSVTKAAEARMKRD